VDCIEAAHSLLLRVQPFSSRLIQQKIAHALAFELQLQGCIFLPDLGANSSKAHQKTRPRWVGDGARHTKKRDLRRGLAARTFLYPHTPLPHSHRPTARSQSPSPCRPVGRDMDMEMTAQARGWEQHILPAATEAVGRQRPTAHG
jgi:hypothetical protein